MTKAEALQKFWSSFGLPAYEKTAVPTGSDAPAFPYITYECNFGSFDETIPLTADLWFRDSKWTAINAKSQEIAYFIGRGGFTLPCNGGAIWIKRGSPFSQHMSDPSDNMIRRIVLNIELECFTEN